MRRHIKLLNKKLNNQLLILILLAILFPLVILQVQQRQSLRQDAQQGEKPNIIVIMTDDHRFDALETLPTVTGRLANNGVTFTNAYITTPLCCPSRASFLTGLYAHNTGVWSNDGPNGGFHVFQKKEKETIAVWLKKAGYKTGVFGKIMNGYTNGKHVSPGWDEWYVAVGGSQYFNMTVSDNGNVKKLGKSNYFEDEVSARALQFINQTKSPFFLLYGTNIPHGSGESDSGPGGLDAPELPQRYKGKCNDISNWKKPPSFNEKDVSDKPNWVKNLNGPSEKDVEVYRKGQLCSLKVVNEAINKMIQAVGKDRMQNTVFIFYADNGYSYGEHRYVKKNCFYEECAKTPLIISYPKLITEKKTSDAIVSHIDITATIADLAGAALPKNVNGISLKPILEGKAEEIRQAILIELHKVGEVPTGAAVRSDQYKYIELSTGEKELYDLKDDPNELDNIINKASSKKTENQLAEYLDLLKNNKVPPLPTQSPTPTDTPTPTTTLTPTTDPDSQAATPTGEETDDGTTDGTGETEIVLTLTLDGIGSGGDLVNKTDSSLSNKDPYSLTRIVSLEFWKGNSKVKTVESSVDYDNRSGKYVGSVFVDSTLPDDNYTLKVKLPNYLVKKIPNTVSIKSGAITLPDVSLVTGDINGDNELSLLDYNLMLKCYGPEEIPDSCFDENGVIGDLNDDAYVLEVDYNLFVRELSKIKKGD